MSLEHAIKVTAFFKMFPIYTEDLAPRTLDNAKSFSLGGKKQMPPGLLYLL